MAVGLLQHPHLLFFFSEACVRKGEGVHNRKVGWDPPELPTNLLIFLIVVTVPVPVPIPVAAAGLASAAPAALSASAAGFGSQAFWLAWLSCTASGTGTG